MAASAPASASSRGSLTYKDCIANRGAHGCQRPSHNSLSDPEAIATSPDGKSVYVAGFQSISSFEATPTGRLVYTGCIANKGLHGCAGTGSDTPLIGPTGVAVSPDGRSVYVASPQANTVSIFDRATNDTLSYAGCISSDNASGCKHAAHHRSLAAPHDVDVSPDGNSVYVVSDRNPAAITRFSRASSGALKYEGCIGGRRRSGCDRKAGHSIKRAFHLTVSPDGKSVYVTALYAGGSITHFKRRRNGELAYRGCIGTEGGYSCQVQRSLQNAGAATVSPDGESVYVVGDSAITEFHRASNGTLRYQACMAWLGYFHCPRTPHQTSFNDSVVVSGDGKSVYATSFRGLAYFTRARSGRLSFAGCFANRGANGCRKPRHNSLGVLYGGELAVSPDDKSVYLASAADNAVTRFER